MLIELLFLVIALRHYSHHALYLSLWHYTRDEFKCSKVISLHNTFDVARGYYICIRESLCITSRSVIEISDWTW